MINSITVYVRFGKGKDNICDIFWFIEQIITHLYHDHPGWLLWFTIDNLNIHHNPEITELTVEAGHQYETKESYWSYDGTISCFFNTICLNFLAEYLQEDWSEIEWSWCSIFHFLIASSSESEE